MTDCLLIIRRGEHKGGIALRCVDKVGLHLRGVLQVELANALDPACIDHMDCACLHDALKGDQAHKEEGGKDDQTKHIKGRSQLGDLSHKSQAIKPLDTAPTK